MTDVMYELPDIENKGKFVVNERVIRKEQPLFEKKPASDKKSA